MEYTEEDLKGKSGIYMWTSPSDKKYIGQAKNLWRRYNNFLHSTEYTKYKSRIDEARRKYPDFNLWNYEILEFCECNVMDEREMFYIQRYNTYNYGYNATEGGGGTRGMSPTEEAIEKNRIAHLGRTPWNKDIEYDNIYKPILQYGLDGTFIKCWNSIKNAAKNTNTNNGMISSCLRGRANRGGNYMWRYYDGENIPLSIEPYKKYTPTAEAILKRKETIKERGRNFEGANNPFYGKTHTQETINKIRATKIKNGTTGLGVKRGHLSSEQKDKIQETRRILGLNKKIDCYLADGTFVKEFSSVNEAQRELNLTHVTECCKGQRKTVKGYIFKYHID